MSTPRDVRDTCPKCDAVGTLREVKPGVFVLTIEHDAKCEFYGARVGNGRAN